MEIKIYNCWLYDKLSAIYHICGKIKKIVYTILGFWNSAIQLLLCLQVWSSRYLLGNSLWLQRSPADHCTGSRLQHPQGQSEGSQRCLVHSSCHICYQPTVGCYHRLYLHIVRVPKRICSCFFTGSSSRHHSHNGSGLHSKGELFINNGKSIVSSDRLTYAGG